MHGHWVPDDTRFFSESDVDAVLVVGDLAGLRWEPTLRIAREIGRIRRPTLVIAGNHDGPNPAQLLAEVTGAPRLGDPFASRQDARWEALDEALGEAVLGGYSVHEVGPSADRVTVVMGRPQSLGGPTLTFAGFVARRFGVADLEASAAKLCAVVDSVRTERIVFMAHNGPTGLGATRSDIWGRDFSSAEGDWGDPDLEVAVEHARASGRRVLAVVAGHMHHRLRGGGERTWKVERGGTLYVNAARVPRIDRSGRHHLRLEIEGDRVSVADVRVLE